ncbi:hypothetical protein [Arcobacter ellisii]|uniref:Response regulator receiver domain-containing protein n=1 Tax=Arcobacter ellisii TaxID=913109 RepID=A0A347UBW2_9BACT|nr:hypothetical protein [Arcobacter ellisii]AXX96340.1 hypothetical protein AELL_2736 [Arcobacter ellisii]RXI31820.1 hypothetical protein CP962_03295 [Arcobacter ellisii]
MKLGFVDDETSSIINFRGWFVDDYILEIFEVDDSISAEEIAQKVLLSNLDMLIIDFKLDENGNTSIDGNKVATEVRKLLPKLPLTILTSHERDAVSHVDDGMLLRSKDELSEEYIDIFKMKVFNTINNYQSAVRKNKDIVKELSEKKLEISLNEKEEEDLFNAYQFLNEIYPNDPTLKGYLTRPGELHTLVDLLEESRKMIESLKK